MTMDFKDAKTALWNFLGATKLMVLSTCEGQDITARTVNIIPFDGKLYVMTIRTSNKCRQIESNPHIALCEGAFRATGRAILLGSPANPANQSPSAHYQKASPSGFARYGTDPAAELLEICLSSVSWGTMEQGKVTAYSINFETETAEQSNPSQF